MAHIPTYPELERANILLEKALDGYQEQIQQLQATILRFTMVPLQTGIVISTCQPAVLCREDLVKGTTLVFADFSKILPEETAILTEPPDEEGLMDASYRDGKYGETLNVEAVLKEYKTGAVRVVNKHPGSVLLVTRGDVIEVAHPAFPVSPRDIVLLNPVSLQIVKVHDLSRLSGRIVKVATVVVGGFCTVQEEEETRLIFTAGNDIGAGDYVLLDESDTVVVYNFGQNSPAGETLPFNSADN